jgi:hypothetical protein
MTAPGIGGSGWFAFSDFLQFWIKIVKNNKANPDFFI